MSEYSKLLVKTEQWHTDKLTLLINSRQIIKPKFQRKQRWTIHPKKTKSKSPPSYSEYIEFLYKTKHTVNVISFGTLIDNNKLKYLNIDGNNRINAIIRFINQPLLILRDRFLNEIDILKNYISYEDIIKIDYNEICNFRRLKDLNSIFETTKNLDREDAGKVEDAFIIIQENLLIDGKNKFTDNVIINVNTFENGSYDEYNDIFKSTNTHSNELSENELLASMLFSSYIILDKANNQLHYDIIREAKDFYLKRDENEILSNNNNDYTDKMNVFDYMVGLQNLLHKKNDTFPEYNSDGLGLIFKIYKTVYYLNQNSFKDFDANKENFSKNLIKMNNIISLINSKIFNTNLNVKLFGNKVYDLKSCLKKNNLYILCIQILYYIKNDKSSDFIVGQLSKVVIYHLFMTKLCKPKPEEPDYKSQMDEITLLRSNDKLRYEAGGNYIRNFCKQIWVGKENLNQRIKRSDLKKLLKKKIEPKKITYELLRKRNKRRQLNLIDKVLYSIIFKVSAPADWAEEQMSIEHLIPWSSKYEGEISLDRIGNLFPMQLKFNQQRGNKHINNYKEICKEYYDLFISKLCRETETDNEYDNIISYIGNKPFIINIEKYQELCERNETLFIKKFLDYVFK